MPLALVSITASENKEKGKSMIPNVKLSGFGDPTLKVTKVCNLRVGDCVRLVCGFPKTERYVDTSGAPLVVVKAGGEVVKMVRCYSHLSNFTYTGGAIHYVGQETVEVPRDFHTLYLVVDNLYRGEA